MKKSENIRIQGYILNKQRTKQEDQIYEFIICGYSFCNIYLTKVGTKLDGNLSHN
jgi:hypothetical protein